MNSRSIGTTLIALVTLPSCATMPPLGQTVDRPLIGYPGQNPELMGGRNTVWSAHKIGRKEYRPQPNDWTCNASSYVMMYSGHPPEKLERFKKAA